MAFLAPVGHPSRAVPSAIPSAVPFGGKSLSPEPGCHGSQVLRAYSTFNVGGLSHHNSFADAGGRLPSGTIAPGAVVCALTTTWPLLVGTEVRSGLNPGALCRTIIAS